MISCVRGGYGVDYLIDEQRSFWASYSSVGAGRISIERAGGTSTLGRRTRQHIAMDTSENFRLFLNREGKPTEFVRSGADIRPGKNGAFMSVTSDPGSLHLTSGSHLDFLTIPATLLIGRLPDYGSALLQAIDPDNHALIMLERYCRILETVPSLQSPDLIAHAERTLLDLIALASGIKGDDRDEAILNGLRSARLADLIVRIEKHFADPNFSTLALARSTGLSQRHLNKLLARTGTSFAERVLELRLDKAYALLSDPRQTNLRISEIAYAAGFNDISYFNRCFRRKFGCAPGSLR